MLFCPCSCEPPKFTGALSAQKDFSRFRSRSFSCKDVCIKSIICCEVSLGIDCKLRRRTCTRTLALKNLITRGNSLN